MKRLIASFATSTDEKISPICKAMIELIEEREYHKEAVKDITVNSDVALMTKFL
jgi:hypothetical protein